MTRTWLWLWGAVLLVSCGTGSSKKLVVGSRTGTTNMLVAEIAAQHLEHRLQAPVERRLGIGDTIITHQDLVTGQIDLYPISTGIISTILLREAPSSDPEILLERTRGEIARQAQTEIIGPLGFSNQDVVVVATADAGKMETLSDAAKGKTEWKLGVPNEFQQKLNGFTAFSSYHIPMASSVRTVEGQQLFGLLEKRELTMVVTNFVDGHLASPDWKALKDDQSVFSPDHAVLLARTEVLARDPKIKLALNELAGKLTSETMRKLDGEVDLEKKSISTVAGEFLAGAGLK